MQQVGGLSFGASNLVELVRHLARDQAGDVAYTYLVDGETEEVRLTYAELDRQARAVAAELVSLGLAGERALLLYPTGLEFIAGFFGCLYAGVVAVPAYPPRMNRMMARIQTIVDDAQAVVALTTESVLERIGPMLEETPELKWLRWIATDRVPEDRARQWRMPSISDDDLAVLQYTSGSTGTPKGVMLSHGNLSHNVSRISHAFGNPRKGCGVFWLPNYHDMGLVGGILQPLNQGKPNVLMSPMAFLQRPIRWLRAITRYGGTVSGGPNFAYDLCARKIPPERRKGLDLSTWSIAFNGAEPVRAETLDRFVEAFGPYGFRREAFYPCYGLAEATLIVSGGQKEELPRILTLNGRALENGRVVEVNGRMKDRRQLVGCGRALPGQNICIVNPESRSQRSGSEIGEIWVQGPSTARGYWNRLDEADQSFRSYLADSDEGPFLRTGDLGFLKDGELFVTGRRKDLIIIDGRNHFPQDIERSVEGSYPALRHGCCAAFSVDVDSAERLVVVAEVNRRYRNGPREEDGKGGLDPAGRSLLDVKQVIRAIRRAASQYHDLGVHAVVLLKPGSIPKTSSGKIQRYACRAGFLSGTLNAWNEKNGD